MMTDDLKTSEVYFKWTCAKCRMVAFDDYDEAYSHEMTCDGFMSASIPASESKNKASLKQSKIQLKSSSNSLDCLAIQTNIVTPREQSSSVSNKTKSKQKVKESTKLNDSSKASSCANPNHPTRLHSNIPLAPIFQKKLDSSTIKMNKIKNESSLSNTASLDLKELDTYRKNHVKTSNDGARPLLKSTSKRPKLATDCILECIDLTDNHSTIDGQVDSDFISCNDAIPLDPLLFHTLFPSPSHLIPHYSMEDSRNTRNVDTCKPRLPNISNWHNIKVATPSIKSSDTFEYNTKLSSDKVCSYPNIPFRILSSIFDSSTSCLQSATDILPWTEKYKIQNIPNDICGSQNIETAEKLIDFIENWRSHRQDAINTRTEKMREMMGMKRKKVPSKAKQRYLSDDDDDDFTDESDEFDDCGLANVMLLTGPVGCGKTSLVYAIAAKCQCVVLEVNTTMKRSGAAIKNIIEESTQSHSNLALLKGRITQESDEIAIEENISSKDNASLSLVLIDEVDLIFENDGDAGFWSSLQNLTKRALSPIILIASQPPKPLLNSKLIRFVHLTVKRPTPIECASKVCQIAKQEGLTWIKNTVNQGDLLKNRLAEFSKMCHCDLRKIINELQLFTISLNTVTALRRSEIVVPEMESNKDKTSKSVIENLSLKVNYPFIESVSPKTVSSMDSTMVTITGRNFLSFHLSDYSVQILLGGRCLSDVHVLDDRTITGVVPTLGLLTSLESIDVKKSLRYLPITFRIVNSKAETILTSDSSLSRLNDAGLYSGLPNIELLNPESISFMEARSKAHLERRRRKRTTDIACVHNVVDDEASSSLQLSTQLMNEDSCDDLLHNRHTNSVAPSRCLDDSQNCNKSSYESHGSVDIKAVDVAINPCETLHSNHDDVMGPIIVTPLSQELGKSRINFLMESYIHTSLVESDIQYIMDSFDCIGLPIASGSVADVSSKEVGEGGCGKSLLRGITFTDFSFSGANEAYLTRPSSIRERHLLSHSLNFSRGLAMIPSQSCSVKAFYLKDTECEMATNTNGNKTSIEIVQTSDEDSYLPWYMSPCLSLLPHAIRASADRIFGFKDDEISLRSMVFDFDRDQRMERLLELIRILFQALPLQFDVENERMRLELFLDYIPCIRNMCYFEKTKSQHQTTTSTQHRTRLRTSKAHYFEASLECTSGILVANELNEMRLARKT